MNSKISIYSDLSKPNYIDNIRLIVIFEYLLLFSNIWSKLSLTVHRWSFNDEVQIQRGGNDPQQFIKLWTIIIPLYPQYKYAKAQVFSYIH